ncbi:MAG: response regulator [Salibacteraceae bacterium]
MDKVKKILLVDDDPIQILINSKLLKRLELSNEILIAENGQVAFDNHISETDSIPEVIFLDINMPVLNGWEFLNALSTKITTEKPFIYMLSSSISPDDMLKSEEHPMVTEYVTKPLSMDKLESIKKKVLSSK